MKVYPGLFACEGFSIRAAGAVIAVVLWLTAIATAASAATVTTDALDYAPGETVIITGSGWQPGEAVLIELHEEPFTHPDRVWSLYADDNGDFTDTTFVVEEHDIGVTFILRATGLTSGLIAETVFTDGNVRVRTNAAGITFDLGFQVFGQAGCAGTATDSGTDDDVENTAGTQFNKGVGNTESIGLTAEALSDQGGVFINWTAVDTDGSEVTPALPTNQLTICVPGFSGTGSRLYIANYSTGVCGTGTLETGEDCDAGGANGSSSSCCTALCDFRSAGAVCRPSAGVCDLQETCSGSSGVCPSDAKSTAVCRPRAGDCDVAESCNGIGNACPADAFASSSVVCRGGSGDSCDPTEHCTGSSVACPADVIAPSGTVCNPGSGDSCDPDEVCSGIAKAACPDDTITSSGTLCRSGSGDSCDPNEACTGVANQPCPTDVVAPSGTVCNKGSGDSCDPDEVCSGTAKAACPSDTITASGTLCRSGSGDSCDPDEKCTGVADQACPGDVVAPSGTVCNKGSGDSCDPDEVCSAPAKAACPSDTITASGTLCRSGSGDSCDP